MTGSGGTDSDREQFLAEALADLLDRKVPETIPRRPPSSPPNGARWPRSTARSTRSPPGEVVRPQDRGRNRIGGMGRVLLAVDHALGRKVAIKTLAPRYADDAQLQARFMGEARAPARVSHPHIVRIYNLGPAGEPPHFVMEYLEGAPLTRAAAALTFPQRAELMRKVVLAADFLHMQGIIHRDLKPGNILVGRRPRAQAPRFRTRPRPGSCISGSRELGEVAGTPEYLSPEQASGDQLDPRSDIFTLGAILYELLTGTAPFRGGNAADLLRRIREQDPELPRAHRAFRPQRPAKYLPQGSRKGPRASLYLGPRNGRRSAPLSGGRASAGRTGGLFPLDRRPGERTPARPEKLAARPNRLRSGIRCVAQTLRAAGGARRRLDHGSAAPDPPAGDPLFRRLDAGRGRRSAHILPFSRNSRVRSPLR